MADRVNPMGHRVETAGRKAMVDGILAKPDLQQLPPSNNSMLPLRQPRNTSIPVHASSPQPAYIAG